VHKDLKFCTPKEALDKTRFIPHSFHRIAQFFPSMWDIEAAYIAELNPFELLPEPLARVELRGIGRQALQMEVVRAVREKLLDGVAAVNGRAIPDDHHPARHLAQQML
jgi:hypothetical protein